MPKHDMKFHRDIGFPNDLHIPTGRMSLSHRGHAIDRSNNHKLGEFELPDTLYVDLSDIIEVKTQNGEAWRILTRTHYDDEFDMCCVINVQQHALVTAWRNYKSDKHHTLDRSEYNEPSEF